jgi:hypothetical protein
MNTDQSMLILTVDGLGTRDLGPYGNTWIETPTIDRLAARSVLFENTLADDWDLGKSLAAMAIGRSDDQSPEGGRPMQDLNRKSGGAALLFTDDPAAFPRALIQSVFDRIIELPRSTSTQSADAWDQTHCAAFCAQLLDVRRSLGRPHLLWAHYSGLTQAWDAPYDWRERFVEDEDPQPPTGVEVPCLAAERIDPDQQLRYYQCLAAEVSVLDACLSPLIEEWLESSDFLVLSSPRGFPLGEHGIVGYPSPTLYSEHTSVPLLIGAPDEPIGWRSQELIQPRMVSQWLQRWAAEVSSRRTLNALMADCTGVSRAICRSPNGSALRVEQWLLMAEGERRELYAKPDDRWEFNDVSSRCPQWVEQLSTELESMVAGSDRGRAFT